MTLESETTSKESEHSLSAMHTLSVISAGLSTPSTTRNIADRIAAAVSSAVSARGEEIHVRVIELKDLAVDLAQAMVSPGTQTPALREALEAVAHADGIVAVTPVFKASYTGLFKTFFDVLDPKAIVDTPVLIAATAGSPRHSLVLEYSVRPLFAYLRAAVVPTGIFAATEDFGTAAGAGLGRRIDQAAGELAEKIVTQKDFVGGLGGATAQGGRPGFSTPRTSSDEEQLGASLAEFSRLLAAHDGSTPPPAGPA